MIKEKELLFFLKKLNEENGNLVNKDTIAKLVSELLLHSKTKPLPSLESAQNSLKFKKIFISLLQTLQKNQKRLSDIANYLANFPDKITEKELEYIQKLVNIFSFNMRSKNLFKDHNEEKLKDFIKSTLITISSQEEIRLLPTNNLSKLTKISLLLHSQQYAREIADENSSVHIIHFYENEKGKDNYLGKPRAAEYLQPYDSDSEEDDMLSFDKTSHALGSGIYGVGKLTSDEIDKQISRNSCYQIVEIKKPLRLFDQLKNSNGVGEAELWTELSKYLQKICDEIKIKQQKSRAKKKISREQALALVTEANKSLLEEKAMILSQFKAISLPQEVIIELIIYSLQEFFIASKAKNSNFLVAMPINYLIGNLGFTGVVSDANDKFSRGLILTNVEESCLKIAVKNTSDPLSTTFSTKIKPGAAGSLEKKKTKNPKSMEETKKEEPSTSILNLPK